MLFVSEIKKSYSYDKNKCYSLLDQIEQNFPSLSTKNKGNCSDWTLSALPELSLKFADNKMYLNSILCILLFALIINATCGVFTGFELDDADRFWNDKNVSCEVTGENRNPNPDEKENPTYCWAFYKNKTYGSARNLNCCKTVEIPNVDKPDQTLKDIVRVEPDGM